MRNANTARTAARPSARASARASARPGANRAAMAAAALVAWAAAVGCHDGGPPAAPAGPAAGGPVEAARAAVQARQFDAAVADADDYLRGQPHGTRAAEALYYKGFADQERSVAGEAERRRDLYEARAAYLAALNQHPNPLLEGYVRSGLSTVALNQDDFPTAIEQAAAAMPLVDSADTRASLLFNRGLAEQRLSRFTDADQTFRQVEQQYPGTPVAVAARQRVGQREFFVQLATFASPADADRATGSLRANGSVVTRRSDAAGRTVLDVGPFSTYPAARQQRDAVGDAFPTAVVVP